MLQLVAGHKQRGTGGVKGARPPVSREVAHVNADAQQIADGVLVLAAVEPAHGDLAARVPKGASCGHEGVRKRVEKLGLLAAFGLFGILRGHFPGVELVEDFLPEIRAPDRVQREGKLVQADLALLFLLVVAFEAVAFEKSAVFLLEPRMGHLRSGRRLRTEKKGRRPEQHGQKPPQSGARRRSPACAGEEAGDVFAGGIGVHEGSMKSRRNACFLGQSCLVLQETPGLGRAGKLSGLQTGPPR